MNSPAFFEIQADNPQEAMRFYGAVFGWQFTKVPGLPVEYWLIQTENMRGGLLRTACASPAGAKRNERICVLDGSEGF